MNKIEKEEERHYHKLERMYVSAPINQLYQPSIEIGDREATITIAVRSDFFHAANALHGSVYFKMLDDAAFFAANSVVTDSFVVTTDFHIHLLRPVIGGTLTSVGKLTFSSKSLFVAEAQLYNNEDKLVATGSGSFFKSKVQLTEEIGYK